MSSILDVAAAAEAVEVVEAVAVEGFQWGG